MARAIKGKFSLQYAGIILAALSFILGCSIEVDGLSQQAVRTLGVLMATLFLLIFESFNVCVTCMFSSAMLFALGCVDNIGEAFSGFSNHILYFTTASFGISLAFQKSLLSKKLLSVVIRSERLGVRGITFIFMLCAAALSAIMSNVAAVVIFIPYVEMFVDYYQNKEDRKKTRRCMMICLTVSALIGGMITPAGSSMNLICMDMLEKYAGYSMRFVDWMLVGMPLAFVMLVTAFFIVTFVYRPAEPSREELRRYLHETADCGAVTARDVYIALLISGIVFAWILSSWVPAINITVTAITGLALMFLPGFSIMTWEEFSAAISWPTFFVAGNLISIAATATSTGLCDYFAKFFFSTGSDMPEFFMVAQIALVTFLFMAVLPSAPAVITILAPIIIKFAMENGFNPVMLVMASALCVSNIYLFPLDAPLVVAYDRKAFKMFELPKATVWIQLAMVLVVSLWVPVIFKLAF